MNKTLKSKQSIIKKCALFFLTLVLSFFMCMGTSTKSVSGSAATQINYFGTTVPCGKDNGYKPNTKSSWNPWTLLTTPGTIMGLIPDDDPHKGWSLGSFFVEGFSSTTKSSLNSYGQEMPVYLKNAGDTVSFGFKLDQDINKLNGNSQLKIADDKKVVQDCWVEDPYVQGDFHHGVLIIVHTNPQGEQKIATYRDFLKGKSVGANTEVALFEEGDYRLILCYEIYKDTAWGFITDWMDPNGSWFDYRMESYFSVRNGNVMGFPFDLGTGAELKNRSFTETGFRVDLANSKYLKLSVMKENLNSNGTEIVEDTRFNKVIADGSEFTEEGKYTITVENVYTGLTTKKVIYVGVNDVMRCNAATGMSISTINSYIESGYMVDSDGNLVKPMSAQTTTPEASNSTVSQTVSESKKASDSKMWMIVALVSSAVAGVSIIVLTKKL